MTADDKYSSSYRQFNATNSCAIISKTKIIVCNFSCSFGVYVKCVTLSKNNDPHGSCILEITGSKKRD